MGYARSPPFPTLSLLGEHGHVPNFGLLPYFPPSQRAALEGRSPPSTARTAEAPSTQYLRTLVQKPFRACFLGPETLTAGYLVWYLQAATCWGGFKLRSVDLFVGSLPSPSFLWQVFGMGLIWYSMGFAGIPG